MRDRTVLPGALRVAVLPPVLGLVVRAAGFLRVGLACAWPGGDALDDLHGLHDRHGHGGHYRFLE
ncbi:hypothetical protein ACQCQX_14135, partial [Ralstonia pseudosolanacearum]